MGLFFTGKGDTGESVVGATKIDKTSVEIEAVGELDELNSFVGLVKTGKISDEFKNLLTVVQENLFIIQANAAEFMFRDESGSPQYPAPKFSADKVKELEKVIQEYESEVNPGRGFIVAGSNKYSAWLDVLRAISRRAERRVLSFNKIHPLPHEILAYMNRLSSLFFAMARVNAKREESKEENPRYK